MTSISLAGLCTLLGELSSLCCETPRFTTRVGNDKASDSKKSLFKKATRNFRIGGDMTMKKDLTRFVRWPKYVRIQRQKRILLHRLKVPPTINQFTHTVDKNQSAKLLKLLGKYKPETR